MSPSVDPPDPVATCQTTSSEAEDLKHQILSVVSHELRTPLAAVVGYAGLLRMTVGETLPPREATYLANLITQADQLQQMVNTLIDAACLQAGTLGLLSRTFQPGASVEEAHATALPLAAARSQTLTLSLEPSLPEVRADERRVVQVVQALVGNAIKFTPQGGEIAVKVTPCHLGVRVEVLDNGPGVPPARQAALFTGFSQGDMTTTRPKGGMGLGLFVSRGLVEAMGGRLSLDQPAGGGCLAWFELPAASKDTSAS